MRSSPGGLVPAPCTARTSRASPDRRGRSPARAHGARRRPGAAPRPGPSMIRSLPTWVSPARKAGGDFLDEPAVAVWVAERDERAVALVVRCRAGGASLGAAVVEHPARVVED